MSIEHLIGKEEDAQVVVTISGENSDTPNLFIWDKTVPTRPTLIAKIWIYPDGRMTYRSFVPKTTREIPLRSTSIMHSHDLYCGDGERFERGYDPKENL